MLRVGHAVYFGKVVPHIGAWIGSDAGAYRYLPRSVAYMPPGPEMVGMLQRHGFADARHEALSGGITQLLSGTRDR